MIAVDCPRCRKHLKVKPELAGKKVRCPGCKQTVAIPVPSEDATVAPQLPVEAFSATPMTVSAESPRCEESTGEDLEAGTRYHVGAEIARGGMGAILRGIDKDIQREVAVKFLLNAADKRQKARFVEEAQITGQLEHPNIVPIHQLGVHSDGRCFFSMKMVKGRSLAEILKDEPRPSGSGGDYTLGRLLTILVNICNAMAYAHSRQVIHRDLKPANIMVGDFGEVYVMDWGLAKALGTSEPEA
jgi:serine/threonine protein kinase